eukprot:4319742-Amphidinium_carterae.1
MRKAFEEKKEGWKLGMKQHQISLRESVASDHISSKSVQLSCKMRCNQDQSTRCTYSVVVC